MRKSILVFAILLSVFSLALTSCSSDDDNDKTTVPKVETGIYEINLDGALFKEGTKAAVGLIQDNQGNYVNTVTISNGTDFAIVVSGFSRTVGNDVTMDPIGDPGIIITSGSELYSTTSGTMTRTSTSKISFDGTCTKLMDTKVYNITGSVESDAFEVVD